MPKKYHGTHTATVNFEVSVTACTVEDAQTALSELAILPDDTDDVSFSSSTVTSGSSELYEGF